jgi:hypothetical protein
VGIDGAGATLGRQAGWRPKTTNGVGRAPMLLITTAGCMSANFVGNALPPRFGAGVDAASGLERRPHITERIAGLPGFLSFGIENCESSAFRNWLRTEAYGRTEVACEPRNRGGLAHRRPTTLAPEAESPAHPAQASASVQAAMQPASGRGAVVCAQPDATFRGLGVSEDRHHANRDSCHGTLHILYWTPVRRNMGSGGDLLAFQARALLGALKVLLKNCKQES